MKGFEVEFYGDIATGPRYTVDAETGDIARDKVFLNGEGPLADSETDYPGTPEEITDLEAAAAAYDRILGAGLEPGQFYDHDPVDEKGFRVEVYNGTAESPEEVSEADEEVIRQVSEEFDDLF